MAAVTAEMIWKVKFKLLTHPAYSPHLTPTASHIFGLLKYALHWHQFSNYEEIKDAAHMWLHVQLKTFFTDGIRKLVNQSKKCVERIGDYIENDTILVLVYHL